MPYSASRNTSYALVLLLGALGGGLFVAVATRAFPKMMSRMMTGMMQEMMARMEKSGANPSEM